MGEEFKADCVSRRSFLPRFFLIEHPSEIYPVDVVFPVMHGPHAEDGTIQGLLELANIPYVGCDVVASSVAMDKVMAKAVLPVMDCLRAITVLYIGTNLSQIRGRCWMISNPPWDIRVLSNRQIWDPALELQKPVTETSYLTA